MGYVYGDGQGYGVGVIGVNDGSDGYSLEGYVDRAELMKVSRKVLGGEGTDGEVAIVALALQRYLVGEARRGIVDRREYQRVYMREYREGKLRRGKKRKRHGRGSKS